MLHVFSVATGREIAVDYVVAHEVADKLLVYLCGLVVVRIAQIGLVCETEVGVERRAQSLQYEQLLFLVVAIEYLHDLLIGDIVGRCHVERVA